MDFTFADHNCYPGAKCDVESKQYSYTWCDEVTKTWDWSHRYGRQEEIQRYLNTVADTYDLKKEIQFNTKVVAANYVEESGHWIVSTDDGGSYTCQWFVMATGCLSKYNMPKIPGAENFQGR